MFTNYYPHSQPFESGAGQHPSGCLLAWHATQQPNGMYRIDCFREQAGMVLCIFNLSLREVTKASKEFMMIGDKLQANPIRRM